MPKGGRGEGGGGELDAAKRRTYFKPEEVARVPCHGSAQEGMSCQNIPRVFPLPSPRPCGHGYVSALSCANMFWYKVVKRYA